MFPHFEEHHKWLWLTLEFLFFFVETCRGAFLQFTICYEWMDDFFFIVASQVPNELLEEEKAVAKSALEEMD